jgi:hypothetical protein
MRWRIRWIDQTATRNAKSRIALGVSARSRLRE